MQSAIAEQIESLLETPDAFREWLLNKQASEVVGESLNCSKCPIHTFLVESIEGIIPSALDVYCTHITYGPSIQNPHYVVQSDRIKWWCKFIHTLDFESDIAVAYMPINALTCLVALETIDCG